MVVAIQDHSQIHFDSAKWLIVFAILGIPFGLLILSYGNRFFIKICLGVLIILYALYAIFWGICYTTIKKDYKICLFICGSVLGILGGAFGVNGLPLIVYGKMRKWSANDFRATLQAYFLPVSFIGAIGYFMYKI
ncbi:putative membrane protein YfcA [Pedobacter sp. UYEF25]